MFSSTELEGLEEYEPQTSSPWRKIHTSMYQRSVRPLGMSEELESYLGDYLGYGSTEIRAFFEEHKNEAGAVDLAGLKKGFASLNPYLISKRKDCTIWRKRGSISAPGSQMNLEDLVDCEVFVCDRTEQAFVDECSGCAVLIGCCSGPTFVRDCKGCTFWVATRQLRTRDCIDCKFFLHSHTEPIIESSKDLAFAPFAASYPGVAEHFQEAKMDAGPNRFLAIIRLRNFECWPPSLAWKWRRLWPWSPGLNVEEMPPAKHETKPGAEQQGKGIAVISFGKEPVNSMGMQFWKDLSTTFEDVPAACCLGIPFSVDLRIGE
ncbi:rp2 [Symbiodinium sp. CCMP2592]|nr:rp2 [Symbiodinium sp. CCMP2592]